MISRGYLSERSVWQQRRYVIDISDSVVMSNGSVQVERGYKRHMTGMPAKAPDFSSTNYGTAVAGFITGIQKFQSSRWESILESCGSLITKNAPAAETQEDSLDGYREHMYVPSSPPDKRE